MVFEGFVQFRTSDVPDPRGPPGESRILELNPQRRDLILRVTRWPLLEPGTLNLDVPNSVVECLMNYRPLITEPGSSVVYPKPFERIPLFREASLYFSATASAHGVTRDVLVRRAKNPLSQRLELFAGVSLKAQLKLKKHDTVTITMQAAKA
jgi:hypothetical protein